MKIKFNDDLDLSDDNDGDNNDDGDDKDMTLFRVSCPHSDQTRSKFSIFIKTREEREDAV